MEKTIKIITVIVLFTSCTMTATMEELNRKAPQEQFEVSANYQCLYSRGVEFISSFYTETGLVIVVDQPFTHFFDEQKKIGWFKKPHTLVKIEFIDDQTSLVTKNSILHGETYESDQLIHFLRENPCK